MPSDIKDLKAFAERFNTLNPEEQIEMKEGDDRIISADINSLEAVKMVKH